MMKKVILFSVFVCFSIVAVAQITNIPGVGNTVLRTTKKYADIEGSPYLYDTWYPGTVTDKAGKVYSNVLLKYDSYKDCIEVNQDGNVMVLNNETYASFNINFAAAQSNNIIKHEFRNGFKSVGGFDERSYFEILYSGKVMLVKKIATDFVSQNTSNYGTQANIKTFQKKQRYFLITESGEAKEFKLSKKSLLAALPAAKLGEVESFLEKEKIKVKTQDDLIQVFNYYDRLL